MLHKMFHGTCAVVPILLTGTIENTNAGSNAPITQTFNNSPSDAYTHLQISHNFQPMSRFDKIKKTANKAINTVKTHFLKSNVTQEQKEKLDTIVNIIDNAQKDNTLYIKHSPYGSSTGFFINPQGQSQEISLDQIVFGKNETNYLKKNNINIKFFDDLTIDNIINTIKLNKKKHKTIFIDHTSRRAAFINDQGQAQEIPFQNLTNRLKNNNISMKFFNKANALISHLKYAEYLSLENLFSTHNPQ